MIIFFNKKTSFSTNMWDLVCYQGEWGSKTSFKMPNNLWNSSMYDVTAEGERGQRFCDDNIEALLLNNVTIGETGSKIVSNCVTSSMNDPFLQLISLKL